LSLNSMGSGLGPGITSSLSEVAHFTLSLALFVPYCTRHWTFAFL
jgi:hypothetical protein